ncbi:MAG: nitrite reductase/ring-hydroxylating ferredoxin subunit [Gammaproteobacteria bacterium]|jgi:nitrite reductase/ring-hydroxylating ferredoxin subunit
MNSKKKKYYVCEVETLKSSGCYGWESVINDLLVQCFIIYHQNKILSYLNRCPHTGVNLEWLPHQFLDRNNEFIQCATHGALFNIENGLCIHVPCVADKLEVVENAIIESKIYLIL